MAADGTPGVETWSSDAVPVFVNEAAYAEKRIALSITQREVWPVQSDWCSALKELLCAV